MAPLLAGRYATTAATVATTTSTTSTTTATTSTTSTASTTAATTSTTASATAASTSAIPRPQIDKLVQLIESPIFTHVRLQLLEPERCPHLLKALWGLLMLLPQSPAFTTLKGRLAAVPEIGLLRLQLEGRKAERPPSGAPQIDFGQLLDAYRAVQQKHRAKDDGKRREARVGDGAEAAGDAAPAAK